MIEVRHLRRTFGEVVAVDDVSFTAADGRITGLLGPNGAGKTTTLRALYGLLVPDAGEILVDGVDVAREPRTVQARLGVLPDARGLYARLTPREHMRYYGRLYGLDDTAIDESIAELVEVLEMEGIVDRRTSGFSSGERMKVAISRALVHRPRNVVLDEPTTGLDVMSTRAMRSLLRRLRDQGCCVLFSSHVMQEVEALCDEIFVVAKGTVVASGTSGELCTRAGTDDLEEAFVSIIGSDEGLLA